MSASLKRGCGILLIASVVLLSILALLPDADVDHDAGYTSSELSIRETVDGSVTSTSYMNPDGAITDAIAEIVVQGVLHFLCHVGVYN